MIWGRSIVPLTPISMKTKEKNIIISADEAIETVEAKQLANLSNLLQQETSKK